jgi:hypothetical protein
MHGQSGCLAEIQSRTFQVAPVNAGALLHSSNIGADGCLAAAALTPLPPRPIQQAIRIHI